MTKKSLTREQKVFKELAATGKFVNTGKVLIGLRYQRPPQEMTQSEEFIQGVLLGQRRGLACPVVRNWLVYFMLLVLVFGSAMGMVRMAP
jgi:hypothetical protein